MGNGRPPVVAFDDIPPDPSGRYVPIINPRVGHPLRLGVLGHTAVGVFTHWVSNAKMQGGGRTVPHTLPDDTCPHCVELNQRPRWHGYLACWQKAFRRFVIADLSLYAVQTCPELAPSAGVDLRGMELILARDGTSFNSRVRATLSRCEIDPAKIQPSFDVRASLLRVWGLRSDERWRESDT